MTICNRCGALLADINPPGLNPHICPMTTTVPSSIPTPWPNQGQKCDVCGSTALDHTELQCNLNRQEKRLNAKASTASDLTTPTQGNSEVESDARK